MNRYIQSFALTFILYVSIFISFLYSFDEIESINPTQKKGEQIVKFTILQEPKPKEKKEVITQKKEIKKVEKKSIQQKTITKKIKPKEIEQKKNTILQKKKTPEEKKVIKTKQTIVKQQIKQNKSLLKNTINHQDIVKKRKLNQNKYYNKIKQTINQNKSYPRIAIKRGIEGIVKINFTISKHGELLSFNILEGKRVFKKSIAQAVKNSFPLTPPKDLLTSNTSLSLKIAYKLY